MLRLVDDLIEDFRSDVFDRAVDPLGNPRDTLWSQEDALRYANSAAARLASDTLALRRRFSIPVIAGAALIRFPYEEILDELQVSFVIPGLGRRRHLCQFDINDGVCVDDYGQQIYTVPDYDAVGMPTHYTRDFDNSYLRLWKVPYMAGTLDAHAITLPAELYAGMPLPFGTRQDFDLMLMWMKKLAYEKHDADTLDLDRARDFERQYLQTMPDRKSEIDRVRRNGGVMRPS